MVKLSNTVADPGAVVVHPDDALATDGTMVNPAFLNHVALETVTGLVEALDFIIVDDSLFLILSSLLLLFRLAFCEYFQLFYFFPIVYILN